jgi:CDP-glycerol glycerophosphotransferase (TagB/SpsB family)
VFGGENKDQTPYEGSNYDLFMREFLQSERLQALLQSYNYKMIFLPHHNMASQFEGFVTGGNLVSIANTNTNTFQDLIRECDAFITDHSSVSFDIAYLGTPMIYARFDKEEFEERHVAPSWFDHERDGFGPVTYTLDETLDKLETLLKRDCTQDDLYARRIDTTFTYRDQNNCERTVSAIDSLLV